MIAQIKGKIIEAQAAKDALRAVVDVGGVGYEVWMSLASESRIHLGEERPVYISESVTAFDGATTLYGFLTKEEKEFFGQIRQNVDGMGPKKALECLDKISKSMPDFKRAVIDGDVRLLVSVFGFTKKTAEKLIFALRGKMDSWSISSQPKWQDIPPSSSASQALTGLLNLGYRDEEARELLQQVQKTLGENADVARVLKEALRLSAAKLQ